MAIVNCPECSKKLKVADTSVGKKVKCTCGTVFVAEATEAPPAAPSLAEKVLVACTECASTLKVAATSLGKKMKCPKCAGVFVAALPVTAMAERAKVPQRKKHEDEEEPLVFVAADSKDDEFEADEKLPKSKAKSRKVQDDDDEEDEDEDEDEDAPLPAAKPVYPSRLLVNLFVFFLVLAYGAFFAVTHPDINLWDLGLVKQKGIVPVQIRGGDQPGVKKDVPVPPPLTKSKGKMGKGKPAEVKKDEANKDDGKKDEPKDEKQSNLEEQLRDPSNDAFHQDRRSAMLKPRTRLRVGGATFEKSRNG
jgi:Zn-finger nucleic acid-binding protein